MGDLPLSRRGFLGGLGAAALLPLDSAYADLKPPLQAALPGPNTPWAAIRKEFEKGSKTQYNHATLGPITRRVLARIHEASVALAHDPWEAYGYFSGALEATRTQAARLLNSTLEETILTGSTTDGMNILAQGLTFKSGQRILTDRQEHSGGLNGWKYVSRKQGISIDEVELPTPPESAEAIVELFRTKLRPETRVLLVSHVTFATGLRMPIAELAKLAHANGSLLIVDGAQAAGLLQIDVRALQCDAYATSGQKAILGPPGTGLLYISKSARELFDPVVLNDGSKGYTDATGTRSFPTFIGLTLALELLASIGPARIEKRAFELRRSLYEGLQGLPKIRLLSPPAGALSSALVSFSLPPEVQNVRFAERLYKKYGMIVKILPDAVPNGIRVGTHIHLDEGDLASLLKAMREGLT